METKQNQHIEVKEVVLTDSLTIEKMPLLLLLSVVQVALRGVPNLVELVKKGELPPVAVHSTLNNIRHTLMLCAEVTVNAPDTSETDVQGELVAATICDFDRTHEYVLNHIQKVH